MPLIQTTPAPLQLEPPWMAYARTKIGEHELPGALDNPFIVECLREAGLPSNMLHDSTAWCGSFMAKCLYETGFKPPHGPAKARNWLRFGVRLVKPVRGCVDVFSRPPDPESGHVGMHVVEWATKIDVLGGNEDNQVKILPYPQSRYLGSFWPAEYPLMDGTMPAQNLWAPEP